MGKTVIVSPSVMPKKGIGMLLILVENECLEEGDVCGSASSRSRTREMYFLNLLVSILSQDFPVGSNIKYNG